MVEGNIGKFKLSDIFTPYLGFRDQANELFDRFIGYDAIVVDFDGVMAVDYAFTHQYVRNEYAIMLPVKRINVAKALMPMFGIVDNNMKVDGEFKRIDELKRTGDLTRIEDALGAVGYRFVRELVVMGVLTAHQNR
ncbi:MAG: hypothetical protein DRJ03_08030 [Chloroflexi bacterium]|nr:MAG: hypothetical protein DRJ03_08030 [Chloroflexota bacterium]